MRNAIFVALLLPSMLSAQVWTERTGDALMEAAEVASFLAGRTLVFFDNGQSKFSVGGAYSYTYDGGGTAFGRYHVEADGSVCILYRNGFSRCDRYVRNGARVVMLTEKGERFPIRE